MTEEQIEAILQNSESDQLASTIFSQKLLKDWMRRNTIEGMNIPQSLWVFSRFEEFTIEIAGQQKHVDIFKMFQSGAIPTLYYCLLRITPDSMEESYHWVTQARINWVKTRIEEFLGPNTVAYIQSL